MVAEVLAIIPARGGSKSIPRKNIKPLGNIPLIHYSIAAALQAKSVNRVIVSTDDEEIAQIAREGGAEVPFLRPTEYAQDHTLDLPVFQHALRWLSEAEQYRPDLVVQLRPTSPIRPPNCVDRAVEVLLANPEASAVRGVVLSGQNPFKMWRIADDGSLSPLLEIDLSEPYNRPRQELPTTYWQTGHIDVARYETIMEAKSMTGSHIYPLVIDTRYTIDIDTEQDWDRAEWLLERLDIPYVHPSGGSHAPLPQGSADDQSE